MATRDDIVAELMAGETPYKLSKKYPRASVYRVYNELVQSGQIGQADVIHAEDLGNEGAPEYPFVPATPSTPGKTQTLVAEKEAPPQGKAGAEVLDFGPKGLPVEAINRIRGILGISFRPKVLSCPTPELLYPAMVISVTELGFKPMRPDDFIDTVLYQWLDACDIIPYAFIKKSEMDEFAKTYGETEEIIKDEKFRREHGLMTTGEIKDAVLEPLAEKESEMVEDVEEMESQQPDDFEEQDEPVSEKTDVNIPEPESEPEVVSDKPTVAELLRGLHIDNIRKEVEEGGSTGRTESNST